MVSNGRGVELVLSDGYFCERGDVNEDDNMTLFDVLSIVNYIVKNKVEIALGFLSWV